MSVAMVAMARVAVFRSDDGYNWLKMAEMNRRDRRQNSFAAAEGDDRPPVSFHRPPKSEQGERRAPVSLAQ